MYCYIYYIPKTCKTNVSYYRSRCDQYLWREEGSDSENAERLLVLTHDLYSHDLCSFLYACYVSRT